MNRYYLKSHGLHGLVLFGILSFACLDGMRDTFLPDSSISFAKEILPLAGIMILLISKWQLPNLRASRWTWVLAVLFVLLIITTFSTTFIYGNQFSNTISNLGSGGWSVFVKFLTLASLSFYLCVIRQYSPVWFNKIPSIYLGFCVLYSVITITFLATGWAANLPQRNWYGRLAIGYPTMDSMVLYSGIIFSLTCTRKWSIACYHLLFGSVLVMQNTASGYILILIYILCMFFILPWRFKHLPILALALGIGAIWYIYEYLATKFGRFGLLLVDKVNGFAFGNQTSSISLRQEQISRLFNEVLNDPIIWIFGGGGQAGFYVESLFHATLGFAGIIGVSIHVLMIFSICWSIRRKKLGPIPVLLLLAYLVGGISLTAFYLYPFIFIIAYIFSLTHSVTFSRDSWIRPQIYQPLSRSHLYNCNLALKNLSSSSQNHPS